VVAGAREKIPAKSVSFKKVPEFQVEWWPEISTEKFRAGNARLPKTGRQ
jgi:hypothetical protein